MEAIRFESTPDVEDDSHLEELAKSRFNEWIGNEDNIDHVIEAITEPEQSWSSLKYMITSADDQMRQCFPGGIPQHFDDLTNAQKAALIDATTAQRKLVISVFEYTQPTIIDEIQGEIEHEADIAACYRRNPEEAAEYL